MALAPPPSPKGGVTFDLAAIDREMREEEVYLRGGHTARTLVREPDLRVVLIVMKEGSRIEEHKAQGTASVHIVRGRVRMGLPDHTQALAAGQVIILGPEVSHDVEAIEESALLLALGWPNER